MSVVSFSDFQKAKRPYYKEEHLMFQDAIRKFLEKEAAPYYEQWEEDRLVPRSFWKKLGQNGFLCPAVSEEYGGGGGDFALSLVLSEETARIGAGLVGPGGSVQFYDVAVHQRLFQRGLSNAYHARRIQSRRRGRYGVCLQTPSRYAPQ